MRHGGGVLNQSINAVDHYSTTEIKFSTLGSTVLARREMARAHSHKNYQGQL